MDFFAMAYYGIVCGMLGFAAPKLTNRMIRVGISAVVGITSAIIGPVLRGLIGI